MNLSPRLEEEKRKKLPAGSTTSMRPPMRSKLRQPNPVRYGGQGIAKGRRRKHPQSNRPSAFDRLYKQGKQRQQRFDLWEKQKSLRPPPGCTFNPKIAGGERAEKQPRMSRNELVNASVASMLNAVVESDGQGDRTLLVSAYKSRMREIEQDRENARRRANRRNQDTFTELYKMGKRRLRKKEDTLRKAKLRKPQNCTFKPRLESSTYRKKKKGSGRSTPNYFARQGKNSDNGKKTRFDYLYDAHEDERKKRQMELKAALKKRNETNALPSITPPTDQTTRLPKIAKGKRSKPSGGKVMGGRPNKRYDKHLHKEQVEKLRYLKQKQECTFRPNVNRSKRPADGEERVDIVTRLLKEGTLRKQRMRKREKTGLALSGCTFKPQINRAAKGGNAEPGGKPLFQRLYDDGTAALKKREDRYKNRALPKFTPDLSPSKQYFEKHWYSKEHAHQPRPVPVRKSRMLDKMTRRGPAGAEIALLMKRMKRIFMRIDKEKKGVVPKKKVLKCLTFDEATKTLLNSHPALRPLRQPKHVNAIFSVLKLSDPKYMTANEFVSMGKVLHTVHRRNGGGTLPSSPPKGSKKQPGDDGNDDTDAESQLMEEESTGSAYSARDDFQPPVHGNREGACESESEEGIEVPFPGEASREKDPDDVARNEMADDEGPDGHKKPILCTAIALHDFKAKHNNELSFGEGVMIGVTEMDNSDGWWHGKLEDNSWGAFPYSYVHCILNHGDDSYMFDTENNAIFPMPEEDDDEPESIGRFNLETNILTRLDGEAEDWKTAELFKIDW